MPIFSKLIQDNSWAVRRVERYSHTDLTSIEISTSPDIDLKRIKKIAEEVGYEPEKYFYIPFATFNKGLQIDFDIKTSDGKALQLLTSDENAECAALVLATILEKSSYNIKELDGLLSVALPRGNAEFVRSIKSVLEKNKANTDDVEQAIFSDFEYWLSKFQDEYLGITKINKDFEDLITIKYRYMQVIKPINVPILQKLRMQRPVLAFEGVSGTAQREHRIYQAPNGLVFGQAWTGIQDFHDEQDSIKEITTDTSHVLYTKIKDRRKFLTLIGVSQRVREFHLPAFVSVSLTLILISSALANEWNVAAFREYLERSPVVTVLAVIPVLLNMGFVLRGEHVLITNILSWQRAGAIVTSLLMVLCAWLIAIEVSHTCLLIVFAMTTLVASLTLIAVSSALVLQTHDAKEKFDEVKCEHIIPSAS